MKKLLTFIYTGKSTANINDFELYYYEPVNSKKKELEKIEKEFERLTKENEKLYYEMYTV